MMHVKAYNVEFRDHFPYGLQGVMNWGRLKKGEG